MRLFLSLLQFLCSVFWFIFIVVSFHILLKSDVEIKNKQYFCDVKLLRRTTAEGIWRECLKLLLTHKFHAIALFWLWQITAFKLFIVVDEWLRNTISLIANLMLNSSEFARREVDESNANRSVYAGLRICCFLWYNLFKINMYRKKLFLWINIETQAGCWRRH